jgi:hypothetical protein
MLVAEQQDITRPTPEGSNMIVRLNDVCDWLIGD